MSSLPNDRRRTRLRQPRGIARFALRPARTAQRPARLLCVHRLHRARRVGDCRRRLGGGEPRRRTGARGPHPARRRRRLLPDPARSQAGRNRVSAFARRSLRRGNAARHGAHRRWPPRAGRTQGGRRRLSDARRADAQAHDAGGGFARRAQTARSARPPIRSCWRGSISSSATASPSAMRHSRFAAWSRPSRTNWPAASVWARDSWSAKPACARPNCCSPAAWCAGSTG